MPGHPAGPPADGGAAARTTELTEEAIAPLAGYSDSRALRRAFKKWSGFTPEEYVEVTALAAKINEKAVAVGARTSTEGAEIDQA